MKNKLIIILSIGIVAAGGLALYFLKNHQTSPEKLKAEVASTIEYQKKDITGATTMGNLNALITVYEFSDFECPFCARFALDTFPQLKEKYIDTGKVRWVYKFFPLPFHKGAKPAAQASLSAAAQGKFFEYHDLLFKNQPDFSKKDFIKYANDLGLNEAEFNYFQSKNFYKSEIESDLEEGQSRGVQGTPTFFIGKTNSPQSDHEKLVGAQPFEVFSQTLDKF